MTLEGGTQGDISKILNDYMVLPLRRPDLIQDLKLQRQFFNRYLNNTKVAPPLKKLLLDLINDTQNGLVLPSERGRSVTPPYFSPPGVPFIEEVSLGPAPLEEPMQPFPTAPPEMVDMRPFPSAPLEEPFPSAPPMDLLEDEGYVTAESDTESEPEGTFGEYLARDSALYRTAALARREAKRLAQGVYNIYEGATNRLFGAPAPIQEANMQVRDEIIQEIKDRKNNALLLEIQGIKTFSTQLRERKNLLRKYYVGENFEAWFKANLDDIVDVLHGK